MAVIQFVKKAPPDEGRQRQAALLAFSAFSELKHVILVDDDVDLFDTDDVLWALNTRFQGFAAIRSILPNPPNFHLRSAMLVYPAKLFLTAPYLSGLKSTSSAANLKKSIQPNGFLNYSKNNSKRKIPEAFMLQVFFFCIPNASSFTACHCLCLSGLTSLSQNSYFNWKKYSS